MTCEEPHDEDTPQSFFHRLRDSVLALLASPFWLAVGVTMLIETGVNGDPVSPWVQYLAITLSVYVVANYLWESPTEGIEDELDEMADNIEDIRER